MIGSIRLVNPWRGTIWGSYNDRLRVTTADGERWEIHCSVNGDDFYCGRSFSLNEISAWAAAEPLSAAELSVSEGLQEDDLLGEVPATSSDPKEWSWYTVTPNLGESRLTREAKPSSEELAAACREAIEATKLESIELIDRFELWGCDLETGEPLALLLTGNTELDARGTFSPLWRFCVPSVDRENYWPAGASKPPAKEFEDRLNERICRAVEGGRVRFASRLFERLDADTVRELSLPNQTALTTEPISLKRGLLAEPWESEHRELRRKWEQRTEELVAKFGENHGGDVGGRGKSPETDDADSWLDALVLLAKGSKRSLDCSCADAVADVFEHIPSLIREKIAAIRPEEIEDDPPTGYDEIAFRKAIFDAGYEAGLIEALGCALKWHLRVPDAE